MLNYEKQWGIQAWIIMLLLPISILSGCGGGGGGSISPAPAPSVPIPSTFTIGGTVSGLNALALLRLLDMSGSNNTVTRMAIQANGAFIFPGTLTSGTHYAVAVDFPQPTDETCIVTNGTGIVGTANVSNVKVECALNSGYYTIGGTVSGLSAGSSITLLGNDGNIARVSADGPFTIPGYSVTGTSYSVTVETQPAGNLFCTVSNGVGPVTGTVTNINVVCAMPSGYYAYVANIGSVSQFTVGTNGALAPMSIPSIAAGPATSEPTSIAVDPTNHYVYVVNDTVSDYVCSSGSVLQYTIGTGGALTPMTTSSIAVAGCPNVITIDPTGSYAYVLNGNIYQYTIGAGGGLVPVSTSNVVMTGVPTYMAVDPTGHYVYVTGLNYVTSTTAAGIVLQYTIGTDGALTPMAIPSVVAGINPNFLIVDPTGHYVYVLDGHNIWQYTIGPGGALAPMSTPSVQGSGGGYASIDHAGHYFYASGGQYIIGINGELAPVATPTTVEGGSLALDPTSHYLYATYTSTAYGAVSTNEILQYPIGAGGMLTPTYTSSVLTGSNPNAIATTH